MSKKIYEALQKINEDLQSIAKDQSGHGYKFRGIDQVLNALSPLMKKHGVIVGRRDVEFGSDILYVPDKYNTPEKPKPPKQIFRSTLTAKYVFTSTEDGSEFISEGFGEGIDNANCGDKSSAMATSNAYKYVIFEMFSIATEEQKDSDQVTASEKNDKAGDLKKPEPEKGGKNTSFQAPPKDEPKNGSGLFG